ncbi:enoyl-CoA hydratase/isomerase family protein [Leucobacter sp. USCH14]|uniref:enoyl-CoA hydratase/isomerase family protein n=1 Tax=Leucobacter sp. USCH14 TaxID=3024838 RepID=UPI00309F401B
MSATPQSQATDSAEAPLVLVRRTGAITHLTLNRPRAINALNSEMFARLAAAVATAQSDGSSAILLDGAGDRGFCGGGDIKELSQGSARDILAEEYRLDYAISVSTPPVVGIMDGITMGGGIGLAGHAALRVVTERSRLAMPEARIGIVPDVGGHLLLAAAPERLGELLAVSAGDMNAGDAIALGFADAFVPSERLPQLRTALAAGEDPHAAVSRLAEPAPDSELLSARDWWSPIAASVFGAQEAPAAEDPAGTSLRLIRSLEGSDAPEALRLASAVRAMSPTSVAVTLAQLDRTRRRALELPEVLTDDLRTLGRLAALPDFAEGVRAQVIDKDRSPGWKPARIEDLDAAVLDDILDSESRPGEAPLDLEEPARRE